MPTVRPRSRRSRRLGTTADRLTASPEASFDEDEDEDWEGDEELEAFASAFSPEDLQHVLRCVELSEGSDGLTQPHPKSGCVLTSPEGTRVGEAFQMGQGGRRAELLAVEVAAGAAAGGAAYLNLEPVHGPTAGEDAPVAALVASGVRRVVVGILHPVAGTRGQAVAALRAAGISVRVLSDAGVRLRTETATSPEAETIDVPHVPHAPHAPHTAAAELIAAAVAACRKCNRALLYRCATGHPFSVYKYAMTLDGKIATTSGHAAWVTGPVGARARVCAISYTPPPRQHSTGHRQLCTPTNRHKPCEVDPERCKTTAASSPTWEVKALAEHPPSLTVSRLTVTSVLTPPSPRTSTRYTVTLPYLSRLVCPTTLSPSPHAPPAPSTLRNVGAQCGVGRAGALRRGHRGRAHREAGPAP